MDVIDRKQFINTDFKNYPYRDSSRNDELEEKVFNCFKAILIIEQEVSEDKRNTTMTAINLHVNTITSMVLDLINMTKQTLGIYNPNDEFDGLFNIPDFNGDDESFDGVDESFDGVDESQDGADGTLENDLQALYLNK